MMAGCRTARDFSIRLTAEPWMYSVSLTRAYAVGMTYCCPLATKPTWHTRPYSRHV